MSNETNKPDLEAKAQQEIDSMDTMDLIESMIYYKLIELKTVNVTGEDLKQLLLKQICERINIAEDKMRMMYTDLATGSQLSSTLDAIQTIMTYMLETRKIDWNNIELIDKSVKSLISELKKVSL